MAVNNDPINQLIEGFKHFTGRSYREDGPYLGLVNSGQSPRILLIACSDSRVDPSLTLDCDPGDLFVVRNVGALVPPCEIDSAYHGTSAALEFAVCQLGVEHVVVMGHAQCGGMQALVQGDSSASTFVHKWVTLAEPAYKRARVLTGQSEGDVLIRCCELEAVKQSLANLRTFPWVRDREEESQLKLHGWYFDMQVGQLLEYDSQKDAYVRLA